MNKWFDGICNKCGCSIEETSSDGIHDYKNRCSNQECEEYKWHECYDNEELSYYKHLSLSDIITVRIIEDGPKFKITDSDNIKQIIKIQSEEYTLDQFLKMFKVVEYKK
jgi:hypothetical protein